MKPQIISREEIIVEEGIESQVTRWYLSQDGIHEINLANLLDESVWEGCWLDQEKTILLVSYTDILSFGLRALVSTKGQVLRKGIYGVEEHIEDLGLTLININGYGLSGEAGYYGLAEDEEKMALLDWNGKFILGPYFDHIYFEEEENAFYAKKYGREYEAYSITGERIKLSGTSV